jgi:hypothetical protein
MPTKKVAKKVVTKKVSSTTKQIAKKAPVKKSVKTTSTATKSVTKKAVKKSAPKKTVQTKLPALKYADDKTSFWLTDGQILNSLLALEGALSAMMDDVYAYHVKGGRNDFAEWVRVVLCDDKCADELMKAKNAQSAKTIVVKHLGRYSI